MYSYFDGEMLLNFFTSFVLLCTGSLLIWLLFVLIVSNCVRFSWFFCTSLFPFQPFFQVNLG